MGKSIEIDGICNKRFSAVKDAFAANFADGLETGASFAVTIKGKYVVDIWAGWADEARTIPWEENTIVNTYSTTKVMTSLCALILADRGLLNLDAPVARYWPEFAGNGKEKILVRWLMSHSSGLSGFAKPIPGEALYDWEGIIKMLEEQEPWWEPGTRSGYHAITFGYLIGEIVRRITGKTLGTFFRDEVAIPLGADFHIGLAPEEDGRVADLILPPPIKRLPEPNSIAARSLLNPLVNPLNTRDRAWRAAEIPASNGHGNARSAARVGSLFSCRGELDGLRLISKEMIEKALETQQDNIDLVTGMPVKWGLGLGLPSKTFKTLNPHTFYWCGYGGSWLVMDVDAGMCFSYVMNKMENDTMNDTRTIRLRDTLFSVMQEV
jgi:CubicO group peptidase (beta-lactamase class C family)